MIKIGAFEAKAKFSTLIDSAVNGEEVIITRHGKPVIRFVAVESDAAKVKETFEAMKLIRNRNRLAGLDWKELRDTGRK